MNLNVLVRNIRFNEITEILKKRVPFIWWYIVRLYNRKNEANKQEWRTLKKIDFPLIHSVLARRFYFEKQIHQLSEWRKDFIGKIYQSIQGKDCLPSAPQINLKNVLRDFDYLYSETLDPSSRGKDSSFSFWRTHLADKRLIFRMTFWRTKVFALFRDFIKFFTSSKNYFMAKRFFFFKLIKLRIYGFILKGNLTIIRLASCVKKKSEEGLKTFVSRKKWPFLAIFFILPSNCLSFPKWIIFHNSDPDWYFEMSFSSKRKIFSLNQGSIFMLKWKGYKREFKMFKTKELHSSWRGE